MRKSLFVLLASLLALYGRSQDTIITLPLQGPLCAGAHISAYFNLISNGSIDYFRIEISDSAGSFTHPLKLNTISSASILSGVYCISDTVPDTLVFSTHYRIRVAGSDILDTSTDNGNDLAIYPIPPTPYISAHGTGCAGTDTIMISNPDSASQYYWNPPPNTFPDELVYQIGNIGYEPLGAIAGNGYAGDSLDWLGGEPTGIFIDPNGYMLVSDQGNSRVIKFPPHSTSGTEGTIIAGGNGSGPALNQITPAAIFLDAAGNLYVADQANYRVLKFPAGSNSSTNGVVVAGGNGSGTALNQFYPWGICLDNSGNLYVSDNSNGRVLMFPPGSDSSTIGTIVAGNGTVGNDADQLRQPEGICLDPSGNLYVADYYNNRVQKFPAGSTSATNATTVAGYSFFENGNLNSLLNEPTDVFLDRDGYLYVSELSDAVLRFPPGSGPGTAGIPVVGTPGNGLQVLNYPIYPDILYSPKSLWVDSSKNIYVSDYQNMVQKWTPALAANSYIPDVNSYGWYYLSAITPEGCVSKVSDSVFVSFTVNNAVSITGNVLPCVVAGTTDTFRMVNCSNCGTNPSFEWYFNGQPTGDTDTIYVVQNPASQDDVMLAVTSSLTCVSPRDTFSDTYVINTRPGVTAYFTVQPTATPHVWDVLNLCTGPSLSYLWSWGDNSLNGVGDTPSHTYDSAGYYNICVYATANNGCSAYYCDSNTYLFKDQSDQMVYINVVQSLPSGINTLNTSSIPEINHYAGAIHFSDAMTIPTDMVLYDMSGRQIMSKNNFTGTSINIDKTIAQGVYLMTLQNDDYTISRKIAILQ